MLKQASFAQGYLQFQENKGQWDNEVLYRAQLPGGYLYLRKNGLTYNLLDPQDMAALEDYVHGSYHADTTSHLPYVIGPGHKPNQRSARHSSSADDHVDGSSFTIGAHAYKVNFLNADPHVQLISNHPSSATYNYFIGNDPSKWGRNVKSYGGVIYKNLYPQVDMRMYSDNYGLKYDLIAYPGSKPEDIRFQYQGVDKMELKRGQLYLHTSVGQVIEVAPYAYQFIEDKKVEIPCNYRLKGNILRFKISSKYDPDYPLIIDPRFIFATFSGSTADNWGYTATYDKQGNLYMGGIVFGVGYPATSGAYQVSFEGGMNAGSEQPHDISISKFSPDGRNLIYATYLGGSGNEQPQSLIVDGKGNLIIAGRTTNGDSYPHSAKVGDGGDWDITLTELNASGSDLVGSLVIGGTGPDGVNIADKYDISTTGGKHIFSLRRFYGDDARSEVNIDGAGNVVLVGSTQSKDFKIIGNVFQSSFGGGTQDGLVFKAAPDLSKVIWSSYLGGSENDAAYVINFSKNGDLYVAGGTESSNFPMKGSTIQKKYGGRVDGFIAEIRDDGSAIVRSTFLGTDQADQIYGIQSDKDGNVYVGGTTEGVWPVTPGTKTFGSRNGKQFICKLKPDLSAFVYSTVFGSTDSQPASAPNISPTAFLVDRCENVYMAGWGGDIQPSSPEEYPNAGTDNMPIKNPINPRPPDGRDFYFFVLKKDAQDVLFASTYGQSGGFTDHVDGGTSRFDPTGVIYEAICANCGGGAVFPTGPPGVYSRQNGSRKPGEDQAGCNVVGLKIAFDLDGVRGGVAPLNRRKIHCNNEQVTFIDTLYGRTADQWIWDVFNTCDTTNLEALTPVGHAVHDSTMGEPYLFGYTFGQSGCYTVRLIKYKPNDCVEYDTSYTQVKIGDNPAILKIVAQKLPPCNSFKYQFNNFSTNAKNIPFDDSAFVWDFGDGSAPLITNKDTTIIHQFPSEGSYTITLRLQDTASFCNAPLDSSIVISISNELKAIIQAPDTLCIPQEYLLGNASQGGTNFEWIITTPGGSVETFPKGDLSQLPYNFDEPGRYIIKLVAEDTVCKSKDETVDTVLAYPTPSAAFTIDENNVTNKIITFTDHSTSNFPEDAELHYLWNFGDGTTSTEKNPRHLFPKTGTYRVLLTVYNNGGCMDTASAEITETIIPKLAMPDAFTPNGDGLNDHIAPIAFGVTKIDFRIYNRWGQMVFRSNDPQITYLMNKGWNGTYKGKPQEMDTYAYTLHAVFNDGKETTKQGSITLIR